MAINTLATATLFMTQLDKIAVQEAITGWMDANAGQVIYNGGSEVKIPKMSVQGMGDYDREAGYQRGSVTLEYETRKMTQDRGRLFQLDPMDINEANFIPTAGAVMGEFQRTQVVVPVVADRDNGKGKICRFCTWHVYTPDGLPGVGTVDLCCLSQCLWNGFKVHTKLHDSV